jgi:metal-responsive CopG/Arc/MetJ family transcriptional regulator
VILLAIDKDKNTQVLVTFPNELLEAIETYWHDNKLKNRNETIRELVLKGLKDSK